MLYEIMAIFILNVLNQASDFKCIRLPDDAHREISSIEISNMITIKIYRK